MEPFVFYVLESNRPRYLPGQIEEIISQDPSPNTQNNNKSPKDLSLLYGEKAPRAPDGELILRRREIHSGRSLTVSTVEWSVAEKKAVPTIALEGWMVRLQDMHYYQQELRSI